MRKRSQNAALGTLIAAGLGYAIGVLTAPRSGRETRREIRESLLQARKEAEANLKKLHTELETLVTKGKAQAKTATAAARTELEAAIAKAQAVKEKARELLSALHEGDNLDSDLKKIIKEVDTARVSLKTSLEKNAKAADRK